MRTCKICGKLSASNKDHADCIEKRRLELAETNDADLEEISSDGELGPELDALLGHMASHKDD